MHEAEGAACAKGSHPASKGRSEGRKGYAEWEKSRERCGARGPWQGLPLFMGSHQRL